MEKLIELLNKYDKKKGLHTFWKTTQSNKIQIYGKGVCSESYLVSKSYGFIKWLVENEKIDKSKVFSFIDTADKPYEDILCLLALSDEPIKDLISFLK